MKRRKDFAELINRRGYSVAVEVGVGWGGFSDFLLSSCSGITLYSIDPWSPEGAEFRPESQTYVAERLQKYGNRSQIRVLPSVTASFEFAENSVDFVYIDGDHSGEAVKADCEAWWPKIKKGGIMAGHDYQENRPDLRASVDEHGKKYDLNLNLTDKEPGWDDNGKEQGEEANSASWWFEKP